MNRNEIFTTLEQCRNEPLEFYTFPPEEGTFIGTLAYRAWHPKNDEERQKYNLDEIYTNLKKDIITDELLNMFIDILLILGDSKRTSKLNEYEHSIFRKLCTYIQRVQKEAVK